jgi:hypothetical protein
MRVSRIKSRRRPTARIVKRAVLCYAAGAVGTFSWAFLALSGAAACGSDGGSCQALLGFTSRIALAWPAYWGWKILGTG